MLGSIALWLDATKHVANDGDAVTTWSDQSGNGYHATQATAGKKPTYKTGIQNGLPVIRCDGGDLLQTPSIDLTGTNAATLYIVAKRASGGLAIISEFGDGSGAEGTFNAYVNSGKLQTDGRGNVGLSNFISDALLGTTCHVLSAIYDFSLATDETTNWIDGVSAGTRSLNANNTASFSAQLFNIAARADASLFFTGDVGEVLLFSNAHTASQRTLMQSSLGSKWGVTIS